MASASLDSPHAATLRRRLGPLDGAAIVVSNVIGSGIFIVPALVAQMVPHPGWMLGTWAVGGVLAFLGAMAYAELAALRPRAGGEYVYLTEAFGPFVGFLTGWTSLVAGFSGAIAASAVGLAGYLGRFVPAAANDTPWIAIDLLVLTLSVSPQASIALAVIGVLTAVHVAGLGAGRVVQDGLGAMKVIVLVAFVVLGLATGSGGLQHVSSPGGPVALSAWMLALIPVMFSYSGWNAAAYVAEEMRQPERNVPVALGLGTATVVVIYLLLNLVYLYALPVAELGAVDTRVVDAVAERLFGAAIAGPLAAASAVMIAASISAMVLAGPRIYYAMARDGLLFRRVGAIHPRTRTPAAAIVGQSAWAGLLVLTGTFDQLVEYTGFAVVLFAGVAVTAVIVLRRRTPHAPRPFSAWGYPVAPCVFAVASFTMVVNAVWRNPQPSLAGLAVIGAGVPVYWFFTRHGHRT